MILTSGQRCTVPLRQRFTAARVVSSRKSATYGGIPSIGASPGRVDGCTKATAWRRCSSSNTGSKAGSPR